MKLAESLRDPFSRVTRYLEERILRAAYSGETKYAYHGHDGAPYSPYDGMSLMSGPHREAVLQHFRDEGFTVTVRQISAGAPAMGQPDDGAMLTEIMFAWRNE